LPTGGLLTRFNPCKLHSRCTLTRALGSQHPHSSQRQKPRSSIRRSPRPIKSLLRQAEWPSVLLWQEQFLDRKTSRNSCARIYPIRTWIRWQPTPRLEILINQSTVRHQWFNLRSNWRFPLTFRYRNSSPFWRRTRSTILEVDAPSTPGYKCKLYHLRSHRRRMRKRWWRHLCSPNLNSKWRSWGVSLQCSKQLLSRRLQSNYFEVEAWKVP